MKNPYLSFQAWVTSRSPSSRFQARMGRAYFGWLAFKENYLALTGLVIIIILVLVAVLAPYLAPYPPNEAMLQSRLEPVSAAHFLGTDELGRDILSRIIQGARLTL